MPPHIGPLEDGGQQVLVGQLDHLGRAQHRDGDRRMVQRQQGAVRRRGREHVAQPRELVGRHLAMVVAGHARVQGDDPEAVDVVHPVLAAVAVLVEQTGGVLGALVVVAHHPDDLGAHRGRGGLDERPQPSVRRGLGLVGQVAGEDQRLRRGVDVREPVQGPDDSGLGVDDAVLAHAVGEEVGVAEVGHHMTGGGVLAELHGVSLRSSAHPLHPRRCLPREFHRPADRTGGGTMNLRHPAGSFIGRPTKLPRRPA
jgi:hypothetical protein